MRHKLTSCLFKAKQQARQAKQRKAAPKRDRKLHRDQNVQHTQGSMLMQLVFVLVLCGRAAACHGAKRGFNLAMGTTCS
jgi:hypothetical protein